METRAAMDKKSFCWQVNDYGCTDKGLRGLREFKKSGSKCKSITQMQKTDKNNVGSVRRVVLHVM